MLSGGRRSRKRRACGASSMSVRALGAMSCSNCPAPSCVRTEAVKSPGGTDVAAGASSRARSDVRRSESRPDRRRPAAYRAGRTVAAAVRGRAPGAGGGCVAVAPLGRAVLGGPSVLPRSRTGEDCLAVHSRPAVLLRGRAPSWPCWSRVPRRGTAILDAVRLGPAHDATAVTAAQLRGVAERLIAAGQWQAGNPHIVTVSDAGELRPTTHEVIT